tara:strand:- start:354 stop:605 length:252 start_codon:yes stop_codon:yes gene_type:complete
MTSKEFNSLIGEYQELYNVSLVDEMVGYSKKEHAKTVYRKCLKVGKLRLAQKIAYHYNLAETGNSDTVMALGLAIMSQKDNHK